MGIGIPNLRRAAQPILRRFFLARGHAVTFLQALNGSRLALKTGYEYLLGANAGKITF
jgi:hypothetical protein